MKDTLCLDQQVARQVRGRGDIGGAGAGLEAASCRRTGSAVCTTSLCTSFQQNSSNHLYTYLHSARSHVYLHMKILFALIFIGLIADMYAYNLRTLSVNDIQVFITISLEWLPHEIKLYLRGWKNDYEIRTSIWFRKQSIKLFACDYSFIGTWPFYGLWFVC